MNLLLRVLLCASFLALPGHATASGKSYHHGQREYREGGYWQWDSYKCKWIWYAVAKGASYDNHAQTFNFTINNNQPHAQRGNTVYGVHDSAYSYGQPFDSNKFMHLAGEFQSLALRTAGDASNQFNSLGFQAHQNQLELEKERTQALKIQALAQLAESTKAQPSASFVRQHIGTAVDKIGSAIASDANLAVIEAKCADCHGGEAKKGGGQQFSSFAEFDKKMAGIAFDYVTRLDDDNCAVKAELSADQHKELLEYLCKKKQ